MDNLMTVNPAYAGSKDLLSMMAVSRNQWVSLSGAPDTRSIVINSPIKNTNTGIGLSFLSDQIGPTKQTGLYVDYSYLLKFSKNKILALGLKGGFNFYEAGLTDLQTIEENDPTFSQNINRNFLPNFGFGAFYYSPKYYFGASIPKLIKNTINVNGTEIQQVGREEIHLFLMAGYVFDLNEVVKFKPAALTRMVMNAPVSIDLNGTFVFNEKIWLGAMYRVGESFGGMFQLQVTNQLRIGYSYDFPTSDIGAFNNGTHEVMVSFDVNLNRNKEFAQRFF
jgi:type IX secretion system PorP/SprF family membrane protein